VLRRIIRRAIRHVHKLGSREAFFYKLVEALDAEMGAAYPELRQQKTLAQHILKQEEERFSETLEQGMKLLEESIENLSSQMFAGETIFKLYDTYGFPVDLTADIARERNLTLDMAGFEREMAGQRERARASSKFEGEWSQAQQIDCQTNFTGYDYVQDTGQIVALFVENQSVEVLNAGQTGQVVLENTPFYAESGGQAGDKGILSLGNNLFEVKKKKKSGKAFVHLGKLTQGLLKVGDRLLAKIDVNQRQATARNHSATHLMHAALRQVLGSHVKQKGSLVDGERLRFDFAHFEPMIPEQLIQVERLVNQQVLLNLPVQTDLMDLDTAMNSGAMALFGEKYDAKVRVLSMGRDKFSVELCGGTHVKATGDIGLFKITLETGVAAGVRRIEAMTGENALAWVTAANGTLNNLAKMLKTTPHQLEERAQGLLEQIRLQDKELQRLKGKLASSQGSDLTAQAVDIKGVKLLATQLEGVESKQLRDILDQLKNKLGSAAIVLATVQDNKVSLIAGVTADLTAKLKAGDLVNHVAKQVGGKGGGRADMAQAGGTEPEHLASALASVPAWVAEKL